ncbi:MAG: DUF488 domain-containing protein [Acidobacteria bacterium]|nr:DUF488 domain-containing protein [Acidobacteriota bacterium]
MSESSSTRALYTIGHSNLEWEAFVRILGKFDVSLVIDVRSRPHSSRFPQFSQPDFEGALREAGILYLFLGEELGGRPEDPKAYGSNGVVNYSARRRAHDFQRGVDRVLTEMQQRTLALLCAEEDPLSCHRFLMVCPELVARGVEPQHIRKGGVIETQREAEDRLLYAHHFSDVTSGALFPVGRAAALDDAYIAQAQKCAFRVDPQTVDIW